MKIALKSVSETSDEYYAYYNCKSKKVTRSLRTKLLNRGKALGEGSNNNRTVENDIETDLNQLSFSGIDHPLLALYEDTDNWNSYNSEFGKDIIQKGLYPPFRLSNRGRPIVRKSHHSNFRKEFAEERQRNKHPGGIRFQFRKGKGIDRYSCFIDTEKTSKTATKASTLTSTSTKSINNKASVSGGLFHNLRLVSNSKKVNDYYVNMVVQPQQQNPSWSNPNTSAPKAYTGNGVGVFASTNNNVYNNSNGGGMPTATITNSQSPPSNNVPESYFTEAKKGEVNELRQLLRNFSVEKNPMRKREIIKKVIAYMTLGIDVSRLFSEMMLVIETRDLVIKKMVYLFLTNYACSHPELAQMCTNTLQKDCNNDDPMVRGLALRALCGIRLPQMVEYIAEPLKRSLQDPHAYVRKTAVMGMLKLHDLDSEAFEEGKYVDILYDMLRDPDASVVSNCILVLNEVMAKGPDGGMTINRAIMLHLLNRLGEFSEFGVVAVLDLVPKYIPANEDEGYQIMNLLDPVLRTSNAGAFLSVIFAFLSLADNIQTDSQSMKLQIVNRIKAPLITMMAGGSHELAYTLLKHIDALIELCPAVFDDEYRQFYIRYHETTPVKYLKISILSKLANPSNAPDIVAELAECVNDSDITLSRLSVRSMSSIACRDVGGEGCSDSIARRLVDMLDLDIDHVSSEAATALANIVRKHPSLKPLVSPPLPRALKYMKESAGKTSIVYLLGECGDIVPEAPYAIEKLIDSYDKIKQPSVKIALLITTMKLFFLRAPETQHMLGRLLAKATEDVSSQDLHDRALLYYRLLCTTNNNDLSVVKNVVSTDVSTIMTNSNTNFSEDTIDDDIRNELMQEFNSLSIMYGNTSTTFIAEEHQVKFVKMPPEHPLSADAAPVEDLAVNTLADDMQQTSIANQDIVNDAYDPTTTIPDTNTTNTSSQPEVDLLGFGSDPTPSQPVNVTNSSSPSLTLDPSFTISGEDYQSKWASVPDADALVSAVPFRSVPSSTDAIETPLTSVAVLTMASGDLPTELKFFLYAQDVSDGTIYLVQANIAKTGGEGDLLLTVKACGVSLVERQRTLSFVEIIKNALSSFT
eukprot:CAMPEP_0184858358 /NCGR_PEP_ID=MMETSP0580-20130426/3480_1 /TAXON_ID=1118495 /ORGANISM="Dactyliosolen fragilissimus" /LENGTH=1088 /DNA_ID=CAMNT_0027354473 /DNA_START=179 /DNA_END=3445 /DNA_ORIENTATION=+